VIFRRKSDGKRKALRGAETAAPPPQGREGQDEAVRAGKNPARQTPHARQEVSEPQAAGAEQSGIKPGQKKRASAAADALRFACCRPRQGVAASGTFSYRKPGRGSCLPSARSGTR